MKDENEVDDRKKTAPSFSDRFKQFLPHSNRKSAEPNKTEEIIAESNEPYRHETKVFIQSEFVPNNKELPKTETTIQRQIDRPNSKSGKCLPLTECYEMTRNCGRKKSLGEAPPSPVLPKVLFDSTGDFTKEHFEPPVDPESNPNPDAHLIHLNKHIVIDTKKLKRYFKNGIKFAFSQIGLVGLVIGYVILGAIVIMKIESSYEKENQEKIERNRDDFFENVKNSAEKLFNDYLKQNFHLKYNQYRNEEMRINENLFLRQNSQIKQKANVTDSSAFVYRNLIHRINQTETTEAEYEDMTSTSTRPVTRKKRPKFDKKSFNERPKASWYIELDRDAFTRKIKDHLGILYLENEQMEDKDQQTLMVRENVWNYPNSVLYAATVITTIGYGNITPKSNIGKIFTIVYAMIGIPLMFMCLANTGDLLADIFITSYTKCIRYFSKKLCKNKLKMPYSATKFHENKEEMMHEFAIEYDNPNDRHVPIVATIGVLTAYILAGAVIFSITEGWNILDGAYFCFITFTTIGFGDFVPGKRTLETEKQGVIALCSAYLLFGMIIMAMCLKLMQDEVVAKVIVFGQRVGIIDVE